MGRPPCFVLLVLLAAAPVLVAGCDASDDAVPAPSTAGATATTAPTGTPTVAPTSSAAPTTAPRTSTPAPPAPRASGAVPADGTERCVADTFAFTIPRDWFAESSTMLGAGPAPTSTTTVTPSGPDMCRIVDHLDSTAWRVPTARRGFFVVTAPEADAYDVWLRTITAGDDEAQVWDLTTDLDAPTTVRLDGERVVLTPADAPVTATVVRNTAGIRGVRLAYTVRAAGPFGGDVAVGEQMVRIVVLRDGAPVLAVERVRNRYTATPPDFGAAIDAIFATLTLSAR